jgi:glycosyltransferase involved in cell wall biosynthesis
VGYIYDCQHRHLPGYFSSEEIRNRDKTFSDILAFAPVTIVTSEDTKSDLHRYFGPFRSEVAALPFGSARAGPDPRWLGRVDDRVLRKYAVTHPFFLCSNQFWLHKNHKVVFEAIALAKQEGRPIDVVFTGAMEDYRDPAYITELLRYVDTSGVKANCRFLGLIPKLDQIQLMKAAVALVQPTLFEGSPGGGAFEEAVSLGRPTIVSDIPVNWEAAEYVTAFFAPGSAQSLLAALRRVEAEPPTPPSRDSLVAAGEARLRRSGSALLAAFTRAIEISRSRMAA